MPAVFMRPGPSSPEKKPVPVIHASEDGAACRGEVHGEMMCAPACDAVAGRLPPYPIVFEVPEPAQAR